MPYKSREKRNECIRRWKKNHPDKVKAEKALAYQRKRQRQGFTYPCPTLSEEEIKRRKAVADKAYRTKNEEKVKANKRAYYQRNKKRIHVQIKEKRQNDPSFRLRGTLRTRLNAAIRGKHKSGSAVRDLGCSISEFRVYVASLFVKGMSWENHGEWHLDHIKPLCSFDLSDREQFLQAVHYTNYQPLWAIDNLRKNRYATVPPAHESSTGQSG